jgi:hypothetical protein
MQIVQSHRISAVAFTICSTSCADVRQGDRLGSIYSPDLSALSRRLAERGLDPHDQGDVVTFAQTVMPHRLFFADRLRSPTDGVHYWSHPNTAYKLAGVWLAGDAAELGLMTALGARRTERTRCAPFEPRAVVIEIPGEGDQVMAAPGVRRRPDRTIIGLTVLVRDLLTARRVLTAHKVHFLKDRACGRHSLWIAPKDAQNVWLELRQGAATLPG